MEIKTEQTMLQFLTFLDLRAFKRIYWHIIIFLSAFTSSITKEKSFMILVDSLYPEEKSCSLLFCTVLVITFYTVGETKNDLFLVLSYALAYLSLL